MPMKRMLAIGLFASCGALVFGGAFIRAMESPACVVIMEIGAQPQGRF